MRDGQALSAYPAAQARLLLGVAAALDPPLLRPAIRLVAGEPRVEDTTLAGVPATVFGPGRGDGPWPAVVLLSGITERGRRHPAFLRIGRALAAMGCLGVLAEPEGVSVGELSPGLVDASLSAARAVLERPDARPGGIALVGVSGGATLALLVAAEPELAGRVSTVVALAPCCDIEQAVRTATTGTYRYAGETRPFAPGAFARLVVARSVVASLPSGPDRDALRGHLLELDDDHPDPLAALRGWGEEGVGDAGRRALAVLANEDPGRFDELYAALPEAQRRAVESLSAVRVAGRILAPVEIVVGRADKYVPLADAAAFAANCPGARLTIIESLTHAVPRLGLRELRDLRRLDGVLVRLLAAARART
jgi:pimeloyl-ACP methyl ester carboxylesterase